MSDVKASDNTASTESALLYAMHLLHRSFAQDLRHEGDTIEPAQVGILMSLGQGPLTLTELARQHHVKPPTASRSINLLVKAGLVERTVPENNRRVTLLSLTPAGHTRRLNIRERAEQHISTLLNNLAGSEREQLDTGLRILIGALQK